MKSTFLLCFLLFSKSVLSQASLIYGPYLQQGGPNSILISWRTSVACDTKLSSGTSSTVLNNTFTQATAVTTHTVLISGLNPNTKYYYTVTNAANTFTTPTFYFYSAPGVNECRKIRFIATGDCGTGTATQANVKNALKYYAHGNYINGWLLLGDNAYTNGTDVEYSSFFFGTYQNNFLLQNTSLFPCPGNHDYANNATIAENKITAYYDIFDSPTAGQLGGVASNTEAYYSYNYGNVHFISLDSYGTESSLKLYDTLSVQYQWLKQDLNQNSSMWTIVYFHHPPYTMGSHNSDLETDLVSVRQKIIPLLELKKVDVVFNGHSHNLERSWLIKGHNGLEATFSKTLHATDTSSARYDGSPNSCAYIKDSLTNKGIVFALCGSSGWATTTQTSYPHNAMYYSNTLQGMGVYFEVDSNRLDVKFIGEDSLVHDKFTIFKSVNKVRQLSISSSQTISLKASWNGNYDWTNNAATTKQNLFSGFTNTLILVHDSLNCIADTFKITVLPTGISGYQKEKFKIFPNPVSGSNVILKMEDAEKVRSVSLIDMTGKSMEINFSYKEENAFNLKIPKLEAGNYILKVETKSGSYKQKLILDQK